ncbi:hypothetical protein [Sediminicola luteus]|uniref:Uncharacterized protein n=1 Tax=Sediminicola luteus TaxID=319238 RepID=A0A2A4G3K0_9FLAO|nr:hypothetical protein [Sediminicola luteus]PCE62540.1 hypothetical protein B7P33_18050 [Sediminicola luteus]
MGYNISGLAINQNMHGRIYELATHLGFKLSAPRPIDFKSAADNNRQANECDVYFGKQGTILFLDMERYAETCALPHVNTLCFALSETQKAYHLNYCEDGKELRAVLEINGKRLQDSGKRLAKEKETDELYDIICHQIETLIGQRVQDIDPTDKAVRFQLDTIENRLPLVSSDETLPIDENRKWWEFWKMEQKA